MEVKVDPEIAKVTVSRVVSAFDVGRVINQKTVRSQAYSGIIMGIGMALMEHTVYDHRDGGIITSNLADYAVPVNADVHAINVHFIDKPDPYIDPMGIGARGAGEITITGVAPAIANAIYHATGKRIRELPITPVSCCNERSRHFNYFGVAHNSPTLRQFDQAVRQLLCRWLNPCCPDPSCFTAAEVHDLFAAGAAEPVPKKSAPFRSPGPQAEDDGVEGLCPSA